ncbi:hypothetical protein [Methylobacterium sp. D48H]
MSVLDMFASALGAFIVVSVILFPYYKKDNSEEIKSLDRQLKQRSALIASEARNLENIKVATGEQKEQLGQIRALVAENKNCQLGKLRCQAELGRTFLLVQIEWKKSIDVDLHVIDADGNEYFWAKPNKLSRDFPGSRSQLSIDSIGGSSGGVEVWVAPEAKPGSYRVEYVIEASSGGSAEVTGFVFDRYGRKDLPMTNVSSGLNASSRVAAATVVIHQDGQMTIE